MGLRMNNVIDPRTGRTSFITSSDGQAWFWPDGIPADIDRTGNGVPVEYDSTADSVARAILFAGVLFGIVYALSLIGG